MNCISKVKIPDLRTLNFPFPAAAVSGTARTLGGAENTFHLPQLLGTQPWKTTLELPRIIKSMFRKYFWKSSCRQNNNTKQLLTTNLSQNPSPGLAARSGAALILTGSCCGQVTRAPLTQTLPQLPTRPSRYAFGCFPFICTSHECISAPACPSTSSAPTAARLETKLWFLVLFGKVVPKYETISCAGRKSWGKKEASKHEKTRGK